MILDLKEDNPQQSGKEEVGRTFHKLHGLGMNNGLWDRVRRLGSEKLKGCGRVGGASGVPDTPQRSRNSTPGLLRTISVIASKVKVDSRRKIDIPW